MTQHSELSASSAARWMNCPGSVARSRGIPREESIYSAEGTAAHEVARRCLIEDRDADHYLGQQIASFTVSPAMAAGVQIYVDECHRLIDASDVHYVEQPFSLALLDPPWICSAPRILFPAPNAAAN